MKNETINFNESLVKRYIESIRPDDEEIRKEIDMGYSFDGNSFFLYEIRPMFRHPEKIIHSEFAKIRFYKSRQEWNLYWFRANGKFMNLSQHQRT